MEVQRDGVTKVSLTLPAPAIEELDTAIDEETLARIEARGIDLVAIVHEVRSTGYDPSELFTLNDAENGRIIRIWIV